MNRMNEGRRRGRSSSSAAAVDRRAAPLGKSPLAEARTGGVGSRGTDARRPLRGRERAAPVDAGALLAEAPDDREPDPIEVACVAEIKARRASGRSRGFVVEARPAGRYGRWVVRSRESGESYEVAWLSPTFSWCSCADTRTSELPTCKHRAFVERVAPARGEPWPRPYAVLDAHCTQGTVAHPLADVRVYLPAGSRRAIGALLDPGGFVRPKALGSDGVARLRAALSGTRGLTVSAGVEARLRQVEEDDAWRRRWAPFERAVRRHLDGAGPAPRAWAGLSSRLRSTLRPYQIEGVLFAARTRRALLADDMGLGKTVQAIATAILLAELGAVKRALIVCPASLKHQWAREIARHTTDARAVVVEGSMRARRRIIQDSRAPFWILNYETLRSDLGAIQDGIRPDLLVLDEVQRCKNWNTKTAKSVKALRTPLVLGLTGTPMENRLGELHSVLEVVDERALGPMWRLVPELAELEDERLVGIRRLDLVRRRIAPRVMRRTRAAVLSELPERTDQTHDVPLTPAQATVHEHHKQRASRILRKKEPLTEQELLRLMIELNAMRVVANGLALYGYEREVAPHLSKWSPSELLVRFPSPKLERARELLEEQIAAGNRVVVFSQWTRMLRLLDFVMAPSLKEHGARSVLFHGQLSSPHRAEAIEAFHADPDARLFLSTDAGGVGLNLQEAAHTVLHLELPWNPAVFEQRVGRVHRMGQPSSVSVHSIVSTRSLEERIATGIAQKRAIFEGLFSGTADTLRFDETSREPLAARMRTLLEIEAPVGAEASVRLVQVSEPIDKETRRPSPPVPFALRSVVEETDDAARGPDISPERVRDAFATDAAGGSDPLVASASEAPPETETDAVGPSTQEEHRGYNATPAPRHAEDAPDESLVVDVGALLSTAIDAPAGVALPLRVERRGEGVRLEMPSVSAEAWAHLARFLGALAAPRSEP